MNRSPLSSTLALGAVVIGVPLACITRLSYGLLPVKPLDLVLVIAVIAWLLVAKAAVDQTAPLDTLADHPLSPRWQAHRLVEQSMLGVGFSRTPSTDENTLAAVTAPVDNVVQFLPPPAAPPSFGGDVADRSVGEPVVPVAPRPEPAMPSFLATEMYTVQRSDTFWSITDALLGDGREWKSIQAINIGREVAPGVTLGEADELRIGWSILIPLVEIPISEDLA